MLKKNCRSARTGKYVAVAYANKHPGATVKEARKAKKLATKT